MWAYFAIFAKSVCAVCLAIGLFTRLAALIILIEMVIIVFFFQWQFGYFWTVKGYEYALLWSLLLLSHLIPWRWPVFGRSAAPARSSNRVPAGGRLVSVGDFLHVVVAMSAIGPKQT